MYSRGPASINFDGNYHVNINNDLTWRES